MPNPNGSNIAVRELPVAFQDLMPKAAHVARYQDGFFRVEILSDDFPKRTIPIVIKHDPIKGTPRAWGFSPERWVPVRQMVCMNKDCERCTQGRKPRETEQPYRPGGVMTSFPEEEHYWNGRHKKSMCCPDCGRPGTYRVSAPGQAWLPRRVPQIIWLTAEERARFDLVTSPDRQPQTEYEEVERAGLKRRIRRGVVRKPLSQTVDEEVGHTTIRREKFIGDKVVLHFVTGKKTANPLAVINGERVTSERAESAAVAIEELSGQINEAAAIVVDPETSDEDRKEAAKWIQEAREKIAEHRKAFEFNPDDNDPEDSDD